MKTSPVIMEPGENPKSIKGLSVFSAAMSIY